MYPNKADTHLVDFFQVQLGANDFNLSTFGSPLHIRVSIHENGEEIAGSLIKGNRGERKFTKPISWSIKFNPKNNYQIVVEEQSIIADAVRWSIPGTPKIGYWPIAVNNGVINFGKNSKLFFKDTILSKKNDEFIEKQITSFRVTCVAINNALQVYKTETRKKSTSFENLISKGYLSVTPDIQRNWNIKITNDKIDGSSLFVNQAGNRIRFTYNMKNESFGPTGKRIVISSPK